MDNHGIQVVVMFPAEVPLDAQGSAMLSFERTLRTLTKLDVRVVKHLKGDDSKLRARMGLKEREAL
jgi:hypothetical protein